MTWTKALLYMGVCLVLSAYYVSMVRGPAGSEPAPAQLPLLGVRAAEVMEMDIESRRGRARYAWTGHRWKMTEPAGASVSADLVSAIVATLTEPAPADVLTRDEGQAADFGLAEPAFRLTLRGADGAAVTLAIGARNPAGTGVYARREGAPEILLVGLNLQYYVDLALDSLPPVGE